MAKKVTVKTIQKIKDDNEKFSVLTAYDYSTAKYIDEAGIDIARRQPCYGSFGL